MELRPLTSLLTRLRLGFDHSSSDDSLLSGARNGDDPKNNYYQLLHLLPFRSITDLLIIIPSPSTSYILRYEMIITSSFIRRHWNKLDDRFIRLFASPVDLVQLLSEFISLSASSIMAPSNNNDNDSSGMVVHENHFGIKLVNVPSLDELNGFLEQMENRSLLIPSTTSSTKPSTTLTPSTTRQICIPTISLECTVAYGRSKAEVLSIQSLGREMKNQIKSRDYLNMSSYTIHTYLND
jgi:hypothetical protein